MEYSITSLSRLAKVTVRTLHHYDRIGLLTPCIRMSNGRRYYVQEQLLRLHEILYFKQAGFSLKKIKSIFAAKKFDKSAVLAERKEELLEEIKRLQRLISSMDMTISFYKGCKMSEKEVIEKFASLQKKMKEAEQLSIQEFGEEKVNKAKEKLAAMSKEESEEYRSECDQLMKDAIRAIDRNLSPASKEVQEMMQEYFDLLCKFNHVSKEMYLLLRECVLDQKEIYAAFHPKLPSFIYEAMGIFADSAFPGSV